jgi:hypothetical protein
MVDAVAGPIYGDDAKLYYSATLGGAGAVTELDAVIDDAVNSERRSTEVVYRGSAEVQELIGKAKNTITGTLQALVSDTAYLAMRSAYWAKTTLAFAASTGDITHINAQVIRLEGKLKSWNETRGDNDSVKVAFEIVKTPDSTYNTTVSVVSS